MIERSDIDGRPATLIWIAGDFEPVEPPDADLCKIVFDDGEVAFLAVNLDDDDGTGADDEAAWNETLHPRAPDGRFGEKAGEHGGGQKLGGAAERSAKPDIRDNLAREAGDSTQPVRSLDELYERSRAEEPAFREMVEGIAAATGSKAKFSPPDAAGSTLKTRDSTERKMRDELGGDFTKVRDVLRATVVGDSVEGTRKAVVDFIVEHGDAVLRVKDRIVGPTSSGYRDILVNFRTPGGLVAELQFNSKAMVEAKESEGHKAYDRLRQIKPGEATGDTFAQMQDYAKALYERAYHADGDGNWGKAAA